MADIRHRVGIKAPERDVYQALATTDGLAAWWTRDVRGDTAEGGKLEFRFGTEKPGAVMEVVTSTPEHVTWRCVEGPDEWIGTEVSFDLHDGDGETVLIFTHGNWGEPVEFMHHCSTKWAQFLIGLKAGLEGGSAVPYPDNPTISSWS